MWYIQTINDADPCRLQAQYLDGTIDTTRTIHFKPSSSTPAQRRAYTRVLQGHIAISTSIFPSTTTGQTLDAFARQKLWLDGLDYMHGTGHGVGSFLNVHEGPQGISKGSTEALRVGQTTSNEPGFYAEGEFGIRIESVLVVQHVETRAAFGGDVWLGFERLTQVSRFGLVLDRGTDTLAIQVPIQHDHFLDKSLMTSDELHWLKAHNRSCREKLLPFLQGREDKRARRWLKEACP